MSEQIENAMTTKEAVDCFRRMDDELSYMQQVGQHDITHKPMREALAIAIAALSQTYTSEPPTVPGNYWHRESDRHTPCIRSVSDRSPPGLFVDGAPMYWTDWGKERLPVRSIGGEWCGPLTPPE